MKKKRNLILPEKVVIDLMAMTAQLGEVAQHYHKQLGLEDTQDVTRVYERIIKKLMDLDEHDKTEKLSLEEICNEVGIKLPSKGEHNGNH